MNTIPAPRMPVVFIGHGNPMNAIEHNEFHRSWDELGHRLPKPKAVLCISVHWETPRTPRTNALAPRSSTPTSEATTPRAVPHSTSGIRRLRTAADCSLLSRSLDSIRYIRYDSPLNCFRFTHTAFPPAVLASERAQCWENRGLQ